MNPFLNWGTPSWYADASMMSPLNANINQFFGNTQLGPGNTNNPAGYYYTGVYDGITPQNNPATISADPGNNYIPAYHPLLGNLPSLSPTGFNFGGQNFGFGNQINTQTAPPGQNGEPNNDPNWLRNLLQQIVNPNSIFFQNGQNQLSGIGNNGTFQQFTNPISMGYLQGQWNTPGGPFQFIPGGVSPYSAPQSPSTPAPAAPAATLPPTPLSTQNPAFNGGPATGGSPVGMGMLGSSSLPTLFNMGFGNSPFQYMGQGGIFHQ